MVKIITLSKGLETCVDDEDFAGLSEHSWYAVRHRHTWYATREIQVHYRRYHVLMHREVLGLKPRDGLIVDHRSGDGLKNVKSNLRITNSSGNAANQRKRDYTTSSSYKGVTLPVGRNKWVAQITTEGDHNYLGSFNTELEAALTYDYAARNAFGLFACLNFPTAAEQAAHITFKDAT